MNDIRRTILWVIFGFTLVLLWDQWQIHNGRPATFFPTPPARTAQAEAQPAAASAQATALPQAQALNQGGERIAKVEAQPAAPRERVQVSTDVLKLDFDTEGGSVVRAEFLRHRDQHKPETNVVLLDESRDRIYLSQTGLIAGASGGSFPTHKTVMKLVSTERELKDGADSLVVRFESPETGGVRLIKTYTLHRGSYALDVKHEVQNVGSAVVAPQLYLQLVRDGNKLAGESSFYSTFTGPAVYTEAKKYQKVEFSDIEKGKAEYEKVSPNGYIAMVQHYFASAWLLAEGLQREIFARKVDTNLYAVGMITPLEAIDPGSSRTVEARLFVGPQEENKLEALAPGLELVKDYGWLTILAKPLYWLLDKLYGLLHNWGWSIVALVVLLKIAFYWLNAKAYASMAKMKAITPRITEMRERLKDEDAHHPMTDQQMVEHVKKQGITVARRTIAKYRQEAGILGQSKRHQALKPAMNNPMSNQARSAE
ncbi:MAG: membrane protein insertase YidC [Curvibacter sp.]